VEVTESVVVVVVVVVVWTSGECAEKSTLVGGPSVLGGRTAVGAHLVSPSALWHTDR
jgi:hypothetical protein